MHRLITYIISKLYLITPDYSDDLRGKKRAIEITYPFSAVSWAAADRYSLWNFIRCRLGDIDLSKDCRTEAGSLDFIQGGYGCWLKPCTS